jgi:hypothetical protein
MHTIGQPISGFLSTLTSTEGCQVFQRGVELNDSKVGKRLAEKGIGLILMEKYL